METDIVDSFEVAEIAVDKWVENEFWLNHKFIKWERRWDGQYYILIAKSFWKYNKTFTIKLR